MLTFLQADSPRGHSRQGASSELSLQKTCRYLSFKSWIMFPYHVLSFVFGFAKCWQIQWDQHDSLKSTKTHSLSYGIQRRNLNKIEKIRKQSKEIVVCGNRHCQGYSISQLFIPVTKCLKLACQEGKRFVSAHSVGGSQSKMSRLHDLGHVMWMEDSNGRTHGGPWPHSTRASREQAPTQLF